MRNAGGAADLSRAALVRYAILGIPLGCVGLPLYVHLPHYYAEYLPLSLTAIGTIMFATRIIDCFADLWIGYAYDRFTHLRRAFMYAASAMIAAGMFGLFMLPSLAGYAVMVELPLLLGITYLALSVLMIGFYTSGLALTQDYAGNTRISAWREGSLIAGVLLASSLPQVLMQHMDAPKAYLLFALVFMGLLTLAELVSPCYRPRPARKIPRHTSQWKPVLANRPLRWILVLFFFNAIPPSITATLFLFFASDVLHAAVWSGGFLLAYFISAIAAMGAWSMLSARIGKRRALLAAMLLAMVSFVWAYALHEGQVEAFLCICICSGAALGGDLALLPSLLADVLNAGQRQGGLEFGLWNFISKFTLALAAGIALPALDAMGYVPGHHSAQGLAALSMGYALLPCAFKLIALILLYVSPIDRQKPAI